MTFNLADQALNVVMTGLVYGSQMWIACAFGFFVVTREPNDKPQTLGREGEAASEREESLRQAVCSSANQGEIEITIRQPSSSVRRSEQKLAEDFLSQKIRESRESASVLCEPVDWKKWKVADLRKASIAKVCGVRTRPIGSRRNLPKADLIAQYEQQMKRLTKSPFKRSRKEEVA